MAQQESDREDLLREATALIERVELTTTDPTESDPTVVGFRRGGAASFFFGPDPVVQFNTARELRRAYVEGKLYKSESGRLLAMTRRRTETETQLVRHELSNAEASLIVETLQQRLVNLRDALSSGKFQIVGQEPPTADVVGRVRAWLADLPDVLAVASSPHVARESRAKNP